MADSIGTPRLCEGCHAPLVRRHDERNGQWAIRKFCSTHCWDSHRPVTKPSVTGRSRANVLIPGQPCQVCGMPYGGRGRVNRHHIDGNTMNNDLSNIAFLCTQHHNDAHRVGDGRIGGGPRPRIAALMHARAIAGYEQAVPLRDAGMLHYEIAAVLGVGRGTVSRWFRKYEQGKVA